MGDTTAATKRYIVEAFKDQHPAQYTSFFQVSEADVTLHGGNPVQFELKAKEFQGGFVGNIFKGDVTFKGTVDAGLTQANFQRTPQGPSRFQITLK